ncbi:MAG TPA: DUF2892 domain-containing protein [Mesorhizobium sp.]|jgi:amino acid transporter|uniref:YgaP family membrane protein n=1 Tax=Mesorhizobium sp. TaxID=1871066 RepID=UPI002DDD40F0|nr:DUF2892 domain-containing protein [Mesorhizobium sp.]HEV2504532.1 DUF2892 domain-containing protein [Mesorhizobium sp.]
MAFYRKNIGSLHQVVRIVIGAVAAFAALVWLAAPVSYLGGIAGVGLALSGLLGYCPMCAATGLGRRR